MKKILVAVIAFGVTFGTLADVAQTSAAIDQFEPPVSFRDKVIEQHNKAVVDIAAIVSELNTETGAIGFITDTNANVVLTTKVPTGSSMTVLYTPNATNVVTVVDDQTNTVTVLRRVSLNLTGSTNDWQEVITSTQE